MKKGGKTPIGPFEDVFKAWMTIMGGIIMLGIALHLPVKQLMHDLEKSYGAGEEPSMADGGMDSDDDLEMAIAMSMSKPPENYQATNSPSGDNENSNSSASSSSNTTMGMHRFGVPTTTPEPLGMQEAQKQEHWHEARLGHDRDACFYCFVKGTDEDYDVNQREINRTLRSGEPHWHTNYEGHDPDDCFYCFLLANDEPEITIAPHAELPAEGSKEYTWNLEQAAKAKRQRSRWLDALNIHIYIIYMYI